jgi:phage terminase small subunit
MGRGRAKAKQTKVARQLKYSSGGTDLTRLANELGASPSQPVSNQPPNGEPFEDDDEEEDPYARYAELYNEDDDEDEESGPSPQRRGA